MDEGDLMADKCSQLTDSPSAMKYAEDGPFPPVTLFQHIYVGQLKGQSHEIFDFGFFHESVSPKTLSIPLGSFRILFENSQRYLQLKMHSQMEKIFSYKSLGSRVNL
jgi:hypothetical protein